MRKVTIATVSAFIAGTRFASGSTSTDGTTLTLHGNVIARKRQDGRIEATLAGWPTVTTRERLNGLCVMLGKGGMFGQQRFQQFFGDKPITSDEWVVLN